MKELKILGVVLFFTALVYWGVEPFAHSQMHPHVDPASFDFQKEAHQFSDAQLAHAQEALIKAQKGTKVALEAAKETHKTLLEKAKETKAFWDEVKKIDLSKGDAAKGLDTFMNAGCIGCHGVKSQGMPAPMDDATASASFGVVPPDLSSAGYLYDPLFLAAVIKNPTQALNVSHKFNDEKPFPMTPFFGLGGDIQQELADIVAYLVSIAPKKMSDKEVFENACIRCHGVKYDKLHTHSNIESLTSYMGSTPPDLSMMIRSKGEEYLQTFINNPQKGLPGTSMPRVGLKEGTQNQVISYLEKIGDRKKDQRESLGLKIMGFFAFLSLIAILWKLKIWREVH